MNEREVIYQARQAVYALFRRLYTQALDADLLDWLRSERPFAQFPLALNGPSKGALKRLDQDSRKLPLQVLCDDFRQLYIGPGRMAVPPWESVFRNEERHLFDEHTLQVRATYARHGMTFVNKNKTPEDHVAIELEFMQVVTERLLKALDNDDLQAEGILLQEQAEFLQDHLLKWVPDFAKCTQQFAQTAFYTELAVLLEAFLTWDLALLGQLMEMVPAPALEAVP